VRIIQHSHEASFVRKFHAIAAQPLVVGTFRRQRTDEAPAGNAQCFVGARVTLKDAASELLVVAMTAHLYLSGTGVRRRNKGSLKRGLHGGYS
jgi:hypothetical protein